MYKSILIPTDGTEFCEAAVKHGIALAKLCNAKVIGMTVGAPLRLSMPTGMLPSNIKAMIKTEREKMLTERVQFVADQAKAQGVTVETLQAINETPWEAIIQTAIEQHADLIVMASHARRGLSAAVLGSQTHKVLVHSKVPVLVIR
jgi:nucleotide-binding universal stress UspA family protein